MIVPPQVTPLSGRAIRDTVTAVFRGAEFNRSSPIERFWDWLLYQLWRMWHAIPSVESPALTLFIRAVVLLIAVAVLARVVYAFTLERRAVEAGAPRDSRTRAAGARDPLALANDAAGRGDYTTAAHALYAALLLAISRRERVRLHASKTAGDYVRDLRTRSSSLFGRFRDFARSYEVVIYGLGVCDRERYDRLYALAADIVDVPAGTRRG